MARAVGSVRATLEWSADRLGDPDGPIVSVFVHGGFWRARYTAVEIEQLALACAGDGQLEPWVWNVEYPRVGMPGGGWPGTARSVAAAVGAAVDEARGRPVVVIGHSAGGHLALWAAGEQPVCLVVSLAGVCDLEAAVAQRLGNGAVQAFLGADPDADLYAAANPIARLPLRCGVLLIHGDADDTVPVQQSRAFGAAAAAAAVAADSGSRAPGGFGCELHELPGGDHFEVVDPAGRAWPILRGALARLVDERPGIGSV
ncbi:MAG: alpha/beta hydrolase family protein [Solirubrobacteraceae bacterium]